MHFFSRKLDKTRLRYSTFDQELFAAYKAIRHFHFLIEGKKFTLFTDHKLLVSAFYNRSDQIILRQARQLSFISEFTDDVVHIKGDDNIVPDVLSRIEINHEINYISVPQDDIDYKIVAEAQQEDDYIQSVIDESTKLSLNFQEFTINDGMTKIICDTTKSKIRPIVPECYQQSRF